jgi:uncharacterized repeat protein (TIGR03803 family)
MRKLAALIAPAVAATTAATVLVACSGGALHSGINPPVQGSNGSRTPLAHNAASTYKVLFNFNGTNGSNPLGDLIAVNGTLYGTTAGGGASGKGTVFSITPSGTEKVLYSFKGGSDGDVPTAGVTELNGTLYGTTYSGGANGDGTIFSLSADGTHTVLYSFRGGSDGAHPRAGVTNDGGTLYGTTEYGGDSSCTGGLGCGTVYGVTTAGKERVVHAFRSGADGKDPRAGLTLFQSTLYGTTRYGGLGAQGTVFSVTPSGAEKVLWRFGSKNNPAAPEYGNLLAVNGALIGAASTGMDAKCGGIDVGCGSIYAAFPSSPGQLETIATFDGGAGGKRPVSSVTYVIKTNGNYSTTVLYGTTFEGGTSNHGTIYDVVDGETTVLHSFTGGNDGGDPYSGLTLLKGTLYGMTNGAGSKGTVFAVTP